jgi:hypothetical protein
MGGAGYLFAIFTALFIAPLVLGGFIVAQGARRSVVMGWFTFAIACFVAILLGGIFFLLTTPMPV